MLAHLADILLFQAGFNTAVVTAGTTLLGIAAGIVGVFVVLRRRALVADAVSHGTLPGVALAFLGAVALGMDGRSLPVLLTGATATGILAVLAVQWIRDHTRLPEDAAIGTVLSVFFGAGIVLLSHIQTLPGGGQAGLETFLLGAAATMNRGEAVTIAVAATAALAAVALLHKEFAVLAFDPDWAAARGWRTARLDLALLALLVLVVVIGLKAVGLVLVIALVIVPPATARLWYGRIGPMTLLAGAFGGIAGWAGTAASALFADLPAGAVIVLVAAGMFGASLLLAPRRGAVATLLRTARQRRALAGRAMRGEAA
ncbi:MAG: metal ABC transporter permease [Alphaproteobacteria bacterium]